MYEVKSVEFGRSTIEFLLGVFGGAVQFGFNVWQEELRKKLLRHALENMPTGIEWRKISTLCGIIGAEPKETTRLLIELGARGSEKEEDVWALLSDKPLQKSNLIDAQELHMPKQYQP